MERGSEQELGEILEQEGRACATKRQLRREQNDEPYAYSNLVWTAFRPSFFALNVVVFVAPVSPFVVIIWFWPDVASFIV